METAMSFLKLLFVIIGVWLTYKSTCKYAKSWHLPMIFILFGCVLFMTGIEFMSPSEQAWNYWLFEANQEDYGKALLGGILMIIPLIILFAFCGKTFALLLEQNKQITSENSDKSTTLE
jgi:hypothetical protein